MSSGSASNAALMRLKTSRRTMTSESMKTSTEPVALSAPALRAAAGPAPAGSSMTMSSSGGSSAARMAARQRPSVTGWSVAGTTTLSVSPDSIHRRHLAQEKSPT